MRNIRFLLIIWGLLCAQQAWPFACMGYSKHNAVKIQGTIGDRELIQKCPDGVMNPKLPTLFYLSSPGGNIDQIVSVTADLKANLQGAYELSHVIPTVVVYNQCESACIPVLSALNEMARDGLIHLMIDRKTVIGFHGCSDITASDPKGHYSVAGTDRYLRTWMAQGGEQAWINAYHDQFFTAEKIHEMPPEDGHLIGSNLLDYAFVVDTSSPM